MKSLKKLAASSAVTIAALVLAIGLLGYSTIGGARAALTYYSENYISDIQMQEIGVTLQENGKPVATGRALQAAGTDLTGTITDNTDNAGDGNGLLYTLLLAGDAEKKPQSEFHLGVRYAEELAVHNATDNRATGRPITQYVRVTITRYWLEGSKDAEEAQNAKDSEEYKRKRADLDPALIQLWLGGQELSLAPDAKPFAGNNWVEDTTARTAERMVLYYTQPLEPGEVTKPFADTFAVSQDAAAIMVQETVKTSTGDGVTVTRSYLYDNASFRLEVRVDAVQDHNAADAMLSAWGRTATFNENGVLTGIQ